MLTLAGHPRDLGGGFTVRRILPSAAKQGVGPFLFFDHFGPLEVPADANHDVRPHPHIGIATVTYLFEGAIMHRDSVGSVQRIEPDAINWMTAGRGIVHSERTPADLRGVAHRAHGLQLWAALPLADEETLPAFDHYPAATLPEFTQAGIRGRVLIGSAYALSSPVRTFSATLYVDVIAAPGASLVVPPLAEELAIYAVEGPIHVDGTEFAPQTMVVLDSNRVATVQALAGARFMLVGGAPIGARRHMVWNFVSSRVERIEQAKADWAAQRIGMIEGETEWIPFP